MTNFSEQATKLASHLGHKLDPKRWSTSERGESNHCLKCGRFVGVIYWSRQIYGTALGARCEDPSMIQEPDAVRGHKRAEELNTELIAKHRKLIDKFLEIAERKVAVVDDYGDENWEALDGEIERCVLKIARLEGEQAFDLKNGQRVFTVVPIPTSVGPPRDGQRQSWAKYESLWTNIEKEFRGYHHKCKTNLPPVNFDELSGRDFEAYLLKLLRKLGFEDIRGTPITGDQGADIIAIKNGRKIAIQAKRYKGTVGNGAVQEIVAALGFYKADEGWVITSGTFTQSACALAQANGIRLIDGLSLRKIQQG